MPQDLTGLTPALLSVKQAVVGSHKFSTVFGSARSKTINLSIHPKEIDMSTPKLISVPNKEDLATTGPQYITGKVNSVVIQSGNPGVAISGGQNPGTYPISNNVVGAVEATLTAMTNKVNVWASIENGVIVAFAVYDS
jgi:hypothetical protein